MDVTIKNIGYNKGTSGWVKTEIEEGRMEFREGVTQSGDHALYLTHHVGDKKRSMCIAVYNPYDLDNGESGGEWEKYTPLKMDGGSYDPGATCNIYDLTPAAAKAILKVAREWCDVKNENRKEDEELKIAVSFV